MTYSAKSSSSIAVVVPTRGGLVTLQPGATLTGLDLDMDDLRIRALRHASAVKFTEEGARAPEPSPATSRQPSLTPAVSEAQSAAIHSAPRRPADGGEGEEVH